MKDLNTTQTFETTPNILERIAQDIILAYAWVSGPALSEQERFRREVAKARMVERELESTKITL